MRLAVPMKVFSFSNGWQLSTPDLNAPKLDETVQIMSEEVSDDKSEAQKDAGSYVCIGVGS